MFTFGDALRGASGVDVHNPQRHVTACIIRDQGQGSRRLRFSGQKGLPQIGFSNCARVHVGPRRSDKGVDVIAIGDDRSSKQMRARAKVSRVKPLLNHAIPSK